MRRAYELPSISMVGSVTCLRYAECSRAPGCIIRDIVTQCRLLAAPGARSCLSARTQPLTATGAPSQTSTIPYHSIPYHTRCVCWCVPVRASSTFSTIIDWAAAASSVRPICHFATPGFSYAPQIRPKNALIIPRTHARLLRQNSTRFPTLTQPNKANNDGVQ